MTDNFLVKTIQCVNVAWSLSFNRAEHFASAANSAFASPQDKNRCGTFHVFTLRECIQQWEGSLKFLSSGLIPEFPHAWQRWHQISRSYFLLQINITGLVSALVNWFFFCPRSPLFVRDECFRDCHVTDVEEFRQFGNVYFTIMDAHAHSRYKIRHQYMNHKPQISFKSTQNPQLHLLSSNVEFVKFQA